MKRALIVDDRDENRSALGALLRNHGWEVVEACHGAEALEVARQSLPDVVVSDLLMPVMDGYTLLRHWKADERLQRAPFIVFTGTYTDPRDEQLARDLGADEFVVKPVEPGAFLTRLEDTLSRVVREGAAQPRHPTSDTTTVFREYSEVLVRKLEQKQMDLEGLLEESRTREASLRQSESRASAILRAGPAAIAIVTLDGGRIVEANERFCEFAAVPREEAVGATVFDLGLWVDPDMRQRLIEKVRAHGEARDVPVSLRRRTGEIRNVLLSMARVDVPGEREPLVIGMFIDTTERALAERRIQHLSRVRAVMSAINQTIVREADPELLLARACEIAVAEGGFLMAWIGLVDEPGAGVRIAGHAGATEDTLAIVERFVRGDAEGCRCAFTRQALATGEPAICNHIENDPLAAAWRDAALARGYRAMGSFPLKAGGRVVGLFNLYAGEPGFFDADEQRLLAQLADDISFALEAHRRERERQRAEAALRASEERFRLLIEYASDIIAVVDAQGVVRYISPSVERVLGYRPEEVVNRNAFDFLHPDDARTTARALARAVADPASVAQVEHRLRHRDGTWRTVQSTGRSVPGLDPGGFIVVNSRDVTEARRLEEQLRQAQKLEAVGQLAGGIAHDFNNVLTAIMMQAELAEGVEGVPAEARELLREVKGSAERAAGLTRQLLAFSRQQVLQPRTLDLNDVVAGTVRMLQRILGEDIDLRLHLDPQPLWLRADASLLQQVLMNLVVNARDAMPEGGRLEIATSRRAVTAGAATAGGPRPGRYVCLRVTDTGCGIAPEHLPHIFEPFFTTKPPGRGTGLGLATVFGIVTQHGGAIRVSSDAGRGATFEIDLPASEAPEVRPFDEDAEPAPPRGTETILLVEDDPRLRMLTRLVLERQGYEVLEAATGVEALAVWREHGSRVDLVLTDIVMPDGLTGCDLARQLRESRPDLAIVFTSGYSADLATRGMELREGENFVPKPSSPTRLLETVRRALDAPRPR